ncbi:MAG: cation diffusion facilitator family transporter [Bacteroidales bacterium]|nr:cation diffusion facilitator family transporter [Bacteroidales bacterium]
MKQSSRSKQALQVTIVGFVVNVVLSTGKIIAGVSGKSGAMLADGIHSLSDLVTDIMVWFFVGVSDKESDQTHHYGHGKYETFATMLISMVLLAVGIGIFFNGAGAVLKALGGQPPEKPGMIALYAALMSIALKEALYWYTLRTGKSINSMAVVANAWHHRSDALSSVGTSLGIGGAIFLGESWYILDPIAGMVVSFFIARVAWQLGGPSIRELLEAAPSSEIREEMSDIIGKVTGVKDYHNLRARSIGKAMAIEVHIKVDKDLSVEASHNIASQVEILLRQRFGQQTHVGVHVEPFYLKKAADNEVFSKKV